MIESAGNCRKIYVDHTKDRSKPTKIIHGPGNSSDECKVLGDFGSKYAKIRPTEDRGNDATNRKKFNSQHAIVNSSVDEILLQENQKLISEKGEHENIESDFDENDLYQIDNMSLEDTKEKLE